MITSATMRASLAGLSECGNIGKRRHTVGRCRCDDRFFLYQSPLWAYLDACVSKSLPLIIGTTGFSAQQRSRIEEASKTYSIGACPQYECRGQSQLLLA